MRDDTIVAQSTTYGRSGIGIIRISGQYAQDVAYKILRKLPKPRYACYTKFFDKTGFAIDKGIALWFPKPNSFTGEDMLELQGHGNPVILDLLIQFILSIKNIRIARPGEFTERAFLNNKMDLIQAESVMELINANSELAVKASMRSLTGFFSQEIHNLINQLVNIRTMIELELNFPDEGINCAYNMIEYNLQKILNTAKKINKTAALGIVIRDGIKVVLVGLSNSGKSSIFNALLLNNTAIVTNIKGTTRDLLHENIYINGMNFIFTDTAGFRLTNNIIEKIGISKTWDEIQLSDHILFIIDDMLDEKKKNNIIKNYIDRFPDKTRVTVLFNKIDLSGKKACMRKHIHGYNYINISAHTGHGMKILKKHLIESAIGIIDCHSESVFLARNRHVSILHSIIKTIEHAKENWILHQNIECLSEDLKIIQNLLNDIIGVVKPNNILNNIFSNFCIGK